MQILYPEPRKAATTYHALSDNSRRTYASVDSVALVRSLLSAGTSSTEHPRKRLILGRICQGTASLLLGTYRSDIESIIAWFSCSTTFVRLSLPSREKELTNHTLTVHINLENSLLQHCFMTQMRLLCTKVTNSVCSGFDPSGRGIITSEHLVGPWSHTMAFGLGLLSNP